MHEFLYPYFTLLIPIITYICIPTPHTHILIPTKTISPPSTLHLPIFYFFLPPFSLQAHCFTPTKPYAWPPLILSHPCSSYPFSSSISPTASSQYYRHAHNPISPTVFTIPCNHSRPTFSMSMHATNSFKPTTHISNPSCPSLCLPHHSSSISLHLPYPPIFILHIL